MDPKLEYTPCPPWRKCLMCGCMRPEDKLTSDSRAYCINDTECFKAWEVNRSLGLLPHLRGG